MAVVAVMVAAVAEVEAVVPNTAEPGGVCFFPTLTPLTKPPSHFLFTPPTPILPINVPPALSFAGSAGTFFRFWGFTGDPTPVPGAALSFRKASRSKANNPERGFTGRRSGLSKGFVFIEGVGL